MTDLKSSFAATDPSARSAAAMAAGTHAAVADLDVLLDQCVIEEDFQVREMLTWALVRLPPQVVVPRLVAELAHEVPEARQQALHTLSKIGDKSVWPRAEERLGDSDPAVRRTAWYACVALVPEDQQSGLAQRLATEFGKGDAETMLSLSRALLGLEPGLGSKEFEAILAKAESSDEQAIAAHAAATRELLADPASGYAISSKLARLEVAMGRTRAAHG